MAISTRACGVPRVEDRTMSMGDQPTSTIALPGQATSTPWNGLQRSVGTLWRLAKRKPIGAISAAIIVLLVVLAVIGPSIAPYDPTTGKAALRLQGPTFAHPLGADHIGRDILSRLLYGARVSLRVSLGAVLLGSVVGVFIGTVSAYF